MKTRILWAWVVILAPLFASSPGIAATPAFTGVYKFDSAALCATAQHTLAYLNKGQAYDPKVIHAGTIAPIPVERVKATLLFICANQAQLNNPAFIKKYFTFIPWSPNAKHTQALAATKSLIRNLPKNRMVMTKYYIHLAKAQSRPSPLTPYALYALPQDEQHLTLEQANTKSNLTRLKYGKQAILKGALAHHAVTKLAYLNRQDLEAALLQGTIVADFGAPIGKKIFNVHRSNNKPYDKIKSPYEQERYWYFKQVDGIKGYGKDADYKITVTPKATFAADLEHFGLGKLLMIQYQNKSGVTITRAGIFADTGGAFDNNLYQVDYLLGSYTGKNSFIKASHNLPDYVNAYFMVLKSSNTS